MSGFAGSDGVLIGELLKAEQRLRAADFLALQVARLVQGGRLDSRSAASDALLAYLAVGSPDGPASVPEWVERNKRRFVGECVEHRPAEPSREFLDAANRAARNPDQDLGMGEPESAPEPQRVWPLDLQCDSCGWRCSSSRECLVVGDRCPRCEESDPVDAGTMVETAK